MIGEKAEVLKHLIDQPDGMYEVKPWHPKRSLTANAYYWALLAKLAGVLRAARDEIHYELLRRYSVPYLSKEGLPVTAVTKCGTDDLPGYWILREQRGARSGYIRIKGSSDMDSAEFSRLLDGLISECNEVGVPTLPPHEVEKLRGYEKHHSV